MKNSIFCVHITTLIKTKQKKKWNKNTKNIYIPSLKKKRGEKPLCQAFVFN